MAAGLLFRTEQFQVISQLQIWSWRRPYWGPLFFGLGRWVCRLPHSYHFETSLLCFSVGFPVFWTSGLLISLWWSRLVTVGTGDKGMLLTRLSLESFWANLAACLLGLVHGCHPGASPVTAFLEISCAFALVLDPSPQPLSCISYIFLFLRLFPHSGGRHAPVDCCSKGAGVVKFLRPCISEMFFLSLLTCWLLGCV